MSRPEFLVIQKFGIFIDRHVKIKYNLPVLIYFRSFP